MSSLCCPFIFHCHIVSGERPNVFSRKLLTMRKQNTLLPFPRSPAVTIPPCHNKEDSVERETAQPSASTTKKNDPRGPFISFWRLGRGTAQTGRRRRGIISSANPLSVFKRMSYVHRSSAPTCKKTQHTLPFYPIQSNNALVFYWCLIPQFTAFLPSPILQRLALCVLYPFLTPQCTGLSRTPSQLARPTEPRC